MLDGLISKFGQNNVLNAMTNTFTNGIFNGIDQAISQSGLQSFAKDELSQAINQVRQSYKQLPTPHACQCGVNDAVGGIAKDYGNQVGNDMMNCILDDGD